MNKLSARDLEHLMDEDYDDFEDEVHGGFQKHKKKTNDEFDEIKSNQKKKGHFHVKEPLKKEINKSKT